MLAESKNIDTSTPECLVSSIASGNRQSEQLLVSQYWRSLLFIINRRANDMDLASDIAQETFIIVIKKARNGDIENPAAIAAFIRQTGINLLINYYRKETRHKTDAIEDIKIDIPDPNADLSGSVNASQIQKIVKQLMDELPTERDRDLLRRYFVYGEPKAHICSALDLTPEHFDRVLYRARNRFKQILKVKFNIDSSEVSLTHLLLLCALCLPHFHHQNDFLYFFQTSVREKTSTSHLANNTVTERREQHLTSKQFKRQVRYL